MFRIKRGPVGPAGYMPQNTSFAPPAPPPESPALGALMEKIAHLESALLARGAGQQSQQVPTGAVPTGARPVPTQAQPPPAKPANDVFTRPVFTPPADRTPADWSSKGWSLAPVEAKTSAMPRQPVAQTAPPPLPADMAPDDWRSKGWTLAP